MGSDVVTSEMEPEYADVSVQEEAILEEDTEITNIQEQSNQTFTPPPRIVERFYHSGGNRRKSSGPSSRRTSISSTHSHQSNRTLRTGCQSNHVAQHLRRASILESRKAKLADRAAHAEQVRMRAALARATPKISNSEERALAAQQAREKHLAQVASACAEEVRRAKKIAEDMKERKAADERRYRLEMEERLAEAERRRIEYKRNMRRPRTTSVPSPERKKVAAFALQILSPEVAARKIQSVWRARVRRKTVENFLELKLSIDSVHETNFEDVSAMLVDTKVIDCTTRLLLLLGLNERGGNNSDGTTAERTFLSAYLILGHPASILSRDGEQEQDLIQKSKDLVISFEATLAKLNATNRFTANLTQLENLLLVYGPYVSAFNDWKARDSSSFIETMVATFVNLDAIWQSVKDDTQGGVAADYREGIRNNQVILLSKIRKLAGPDRANFLIKKAIRESRRLRVRKRPAGDVRPRPIEGNLGTISERPSSSQSTAMNSDDGSQCNIKSTDENLHALHAPVTSDTLSMASSGKSEDIEEAANASFNKIFTVLPSNRVLTHEIAIDKDYRIDVSPHSLTRDAFNRSICENMQRGFENGEGDRWTWAMARFIKFKLLKLLKEGNSLYNLISEALDPAHVRQQCRQGTFSYAKFFNFMASILPKLCAPFRDEQVKLLVDELRQEGSFADMIERLFKLLHVIDLLNLDYSNFILAQSIPILLKNSEVYERQMFAQDLDSKAISLQKTKSWWRNASVNVLTEADRNDPTQRPTFQKIYSRGIVDLAVATAPLLASDIPETLHLDQMRIARIRSDIIRITSIGAILLTAKNLLKRDVRISWKPEANRIWDILKDNRALSDQTTASKILSVVESSHAMPPTTRTQLSNTINRLLAQATIGRLSDPVAKVLFQRLKTNVLNRVSASSSGERVKAASTATERLSNTGLPEFVGQVGEIVDTLGKISEVDRKAHAPWYEQIAAEVDAAGDSEST